MTPFMAARISVVAVALGALFGCGNNSNFADPDREFGPEVTQTAEQPDVLHTPSPLGVWKAPLTTDPGVPKQAACGTCHGEGATQARVPGTSSDFHVDIELHHADLKCNMCHDTDRTKLHLADKTKIDFGHVVQLCGQCHGTIYRDYKAGIHGGMQGYWDRRRGSRTRNVCTDCHMPHAPAITQVMPAPPPADRPPEDY